MAKFYGPIGYAVSTETVPGVWVDVITEKYYHGDIEKNIRRLEAGEGLNSDIKISNIISIVSDPYATQNFFAMRYIKWMGVYWDVSTVDVLIPRLKLTLGGVYNGPTV